MLRFFPIIFKQNATNQLLLYILDLTTVLLVNNDGMGRLGDNHGRFLSVRPEVGLLTSTARTFIQDGITTEYATQVVGTTLDNGRFYAQYLKKSSRVLYENGSPSVLTSWVGSSQTRSYLQSHNDLINAEAENWRDIDDQFVGNTDYPKFRSASVPEVVKLTKEQLMDGIKKSYGIQYTSSIPTAGEIGADTVLAGGDLPTITVKNHFEPSGYQTNEEIANEEEGTRDTQVEKKNAFKVSHQAKLQTEGQLMQKRVFSTVTYYGFAEFTTVVGDSVIIFSPNSGQPKLNQGHTITSQGIATLSEADKPAQVTTLNSTILGNFLINSTNYWGVTDSKSDSLVASSVDFSTAHVDSFQDEPSVITKITSMLPKDEAIASQKFEVNEMKPSLKLPTDKEILEIYASLSKAQAEISGKLITKEENLPTSLKNILQIEESSSEQSISATTGATTIFIDDDPFANFVEPSVSTLITASTSFPQLPISSILKTYTTSIASIKVPAELPNEDQKHELTEQIDEHYEVTTNPTPKEEDESSSTTPSSETNKIPNRVENKSNQLSLQDTKLSTHRNPSSLIDSTIEIIATTTFDCIEATHVNLEKSSSTEISFMSETELLKPQEEEEITTDEPDSSQSDEMLIDEDTTTQDYLTDPENEEVDDYDSDEVDFIYKTLFTTYTYLTTFFQGETTTVDSHTEIVTNVVTSSVEKVHLQSKDTELIAQIKDNEISATSIETFDLISMSTEKYTIPVELESLLHASSSNALDIQDQTSQSTGYLDDSRYTKTFLTTYTYFTTIFDDSEINIMSQTEVITNYVTESRITPEGKEQLSNEHHMLIADVHSRSSNEKLDIQLKDSIDDQVSSESNTDEIVPSATLLLQTSFTTFTFYTTMYTGNSTNVMSRLETLTNIATETLKPTKILNQEEDTLPITYFTTFTYWTKLAKDGEVRTISREETISNVIEPTENEKTVSTETSFSSILVNKTVESELTTFYTTYTYYTTSYDANKTLTDSRLETVTYIETPISTFLSTAQPPYTPEDVNVINISPPSKSNDVIFYDYKQIIDADGVSTLYFTTQIQSTVNEQGNPIEITNSSSSLQVDETKQKSLSTELENLQDVSSKMYRTGLVRLIKGTRISNSTTTLYQSKVLGTVIENRYAQIIESTSSFLFENSLSELSKSIFSSSILENVVQSTSILEIGASLTAVQNSKISETAEQSLSTEEVGGEDTNEQLQTKKQTFAPVIRPFASRNRPTFAPKQKIISPSSATIITRSDITPTITATPAIKTVGRFVSARRSSYPSEALVGANSTRRIFSRPIKSTGSLIQLVGSTLIPSGFSPSRNRFGSSNRAAPVSSLRRIGISTSNLRLSSPSFRSTVRIKPTSVVSQTLVSSSSGYLNYEEEENSTEDHVNSNEYEENNQNSKLNQNPLLRFRRPLNRPGGFSSLPRTSSRVTISPRKNPLSGRAKPTTTTTTTTTTTPRSKPRSFERPAITRPRSQSNLFPPRGLFQKEKEKRREVEDENDSEYDDDDDVEEEDNQSEANRRRRSNRKTYLKRVRRQLESVNRSRFRFRRPKTVNTEVSPASEELIELIPSTPRSKMNSRFGSRFQSQLSSTSQTPMNHRSIRPTRPMSARTQFTLREKDSSPRMAGSGHFRRNQQVTGRRSTSSVSSPSSSRRLKIYSNNNNIEGSNVRSSSTTRSNRNRGTMRGRIRNDFNQDISSTELGSVTITVTHVIPSEVTVPVVNGHLTEYKQIVTGKTSLEVLGPHQYTQLLGNNGQSSLYLTREESNVNSAGATELTRYLLHDSSTTTVTFTPTTIRGRKTSFSHVLPSTVYSVEQLVSTLQPQISANAPLANILLSQLLLGNINLPALAQPHGTISGLGLTLESTIVPSPVTEYRTHTSTYVTTIYDGKSTILPITFQGKKILTTVFDTTAQTITATEYSVDTIVNTPIQNLQTVQSQLPQVNSLLLQQLLIQQQQQQQLPAVKIPIISPTTSTQIFLSENLQDLDAELPIEDIIVSTTEKNNRKKSRKSHKRTKQKQEAEIEPEGSVITLYVSGRRPGEFSTVLSTVQNSLHKRQVTQHTILHTVKNSYGKLHNEEQEQDLLHLASRNRNQVNQFLDQSKEISDSEVLTSSFESSLGDIDVWHVKATRQITSQPSASF